MIHTLKDMFTLLPFESKDAKQQIFKVDLKVSDELEQSGPKYLAVKKM